MMLFMSTDLNLFCKLSFVDTLLREHWDFLLTISGSIRWDTLNNAFSVVELAISGTRVSGSFVFHANWKDLPLTACGMLRFVGLGSFIWSGVNTPGDQYLVASYMFQRLAIF
jgi:hypothetical protein